MFVPMVGTDVIERRCVAAGEEMILLTGAAGFVGSHLARALDPTFLGQGIRLLDVRPYGGPVPVGMEVTRGSIESKADLQAAVKGVGVIIHLAAYVRPTSTDIDRMVRVNAIGTRNLFVAAVAAGCGHFLHVSSAGVYGPPRGIASFKEGDDARPSTPYQRTKWEAEEALRSTASGATTLNIVRPAGIYGAGSQLELPRYRRLLRRRWSLGLEGGMILNPLHVSDLVAAIMALVARPAEHGTVFNIGGERAIGIDELDVLVAATLGVTHRRLVIPAGIAKPLAMLLAPTLSLFGRPNPLLRAYASGEHFSSVVDDSMFRQQYPGVPTKSIVDGVREHVAWARSERLL